MAMNLEYVSILKTLWISQNFVEDKLVKKFVFLFTEYNYFIQKTLWSDFNTTVKDSKVREEFINQVRDRLVKELNNQQQIVLLKDSSCYTSFKNFVCNWNFPSCDNTNKTIPVCNSICTNYYTNCLLDITPCLQLFRSLEFRVIVDQLNKKQNFIKIIIKLSKMCNQLHHIYDK
ncbi:hypothetical protein pb186bvf_017903 [Paramecium bursaria]